MCIMSGIQAGEQMSGIKKIPLKSDFRKFNR